MSEQTSLHNGVALNSRNTQLESGRSLEQFQDASSLNDKPRLTEQEKKNNHIVSEQKRRHAIREGFDEIAKMVPGLEGQGRSEAIVLQGAVTHMQYLLAERHELLMKAQEVGLPTSSSKPNSGIDKYRLDNQTMKIAANCSTAKEGMGTDT